jgi:hypothetical protein
VEITVDAEADGSLVSIAEDVIDGPAQLVPQPVRVAGIDVCKPRHAALARLPGRTPYISSSRGVSRACANAARAAFMPATPCTAPPGRAEAAAR